MVAVGRVIASVSVRVPVQMPVVIAPVRSITMQRQRRWSSLSSCRYLVAVTIVVVVMVMAVVM